MVGAVVGFGVTGVRPVPRGVGTTAAVPVPEGFPVGVVGVAAVEPADGSGVGAPLGSGAVGLGDGWQPTGAPGPFT